VRPSRSLNESNISEFCPYFCQTMLCQTL